MHKTSNDDFSVLPKLAQKPPRMTENNLKLFFSVFFNVLINV